MSTELMAAREQIARLRVELEEMREFLHLANGTADLALKGRDEAEQDLAELRESQARWDSGGLLVVGERCQRALRAANALMESGGGAYTCAETVRDCMQDALASLPVLPPLPEQGAP